MINYLDQFVITSYLFRNKFSKYEQSIASVHNVFVSCVLPVLNCGLQEPKPFALPGLRAEAIGKKKWR